MAVESTRTPASRALPSGKALVCALAVGFTCACGDGAGADGEPDFGAPPFSGTGNAGSGAVAPPNGSNTAGAPSSLAGAGGSSGTQPNTQSGGGPGVSAGGSGNTLAGAGGAPMTANGGAGGQGGAQVTPPSDFGEGVFFADDFEAGINAAWRNTSNGGGMIAQDTTRGANGTASSVRVDGNGQFHTMLQLALPDSVRAANQLYGRVHLRVDQMPGQGHFVWVEAGSAVGEFLQGNDVNEMRIGYNLGLLQVNHYGGPNGGDQDIRDRNRQLTPGVWHCLQFFMNGNPEALQVWLDDEETALSTTNFTAQREGSEGNTTALVDWMPPFEAVRFGWELSGSTIWYDEVALGDTLPACE